MKSFYSYICVIALSIAAFSPNAQAKECEHSDTWRKVELNEDLLLIAVLRVNNRPISDSIDVYEFDNTYFLPISQLGFLLELPWQFDAAARRFSSNYDGTAYSKYQSTLCEFDINLNAHNDNATGLWYEDDYDTYIEVNSLAKLLVGSATFNEQLQQMNFTSADASLGLKASKTPVNTYFNSQDSKIYPIIKDRYQMLTLPVVNYRLNKSISKDQSSLNYQANLNGSFDLLGLSSEYRLNTSKQRSIQYLRFSKNILSNNTQNQNTELGNLHTIDDKGTKYEFGDITVLGDELLFASKQALGISAYSHSQNQRRNFSNIQIEETALPGWRAILFRNGQFIAEQNVDEDNRIVFTNVATFIGVNRFTIQLFGPQGQEDYKEQVVHVGQNQRQHKHLDFRFNASDASRSLLNGKNTSHSAYNQQLSAILTYGITNKLTAELQWHELIGQSHEQDAPSRFITSSLDYTNWNSLIRAQYARHKNEYNSLVTGQACELVATDTGQADTGQACNTKPSNFGQAVFIGINSNLNKSFVGNFSYRYLDNFNSQKYTRAQGLQQEVRARVNGRINLPFKLGLGFNFSEQRYKTQAIRRSLSMTTSQNLVGGTFSNTLQYRHQRGESSISHRIYLSRYFGKWQLSQSLSWEPFNAKDITQYSANLRWPQQPSTFNETSLSYNKTSNAKFSFSHQFNWQHDVFNFQVGAGIDEKGKWSIKMGVSGSFYKNQVNNKYEFSRMRGNNARRIEAHAFIDNDRNGELSPEDELLPEIAFAGSAQWRGKHTNQSGALELFTLSDYQAISIEEASLSDPFLAANEPTQIVATHPGGVNKVFFALLPVNDIEGHVLSLQNEKHKGLLGLTVRLRELEGEQLWEVQTESDGYFFFTQIPPGKYYIEISEEHLTRLGLTQKQKRMVDAPKFGDIVSVEDIVLIPTTNSDIAFVDDARTEEISPTETATD